MLWAIIGDLDYFSKALLLPKSTLAAGPCPLCRRKGSGPSTWADFRENAPWRDLVWKAEDWRVWEGRSKSPLFDSDEFTPWLLSLDWMRCKYLGYDQLVYGSILALLVHFVMAHLGTPLECLQILWRDIQEYYVQTSTPCRYRYLNKLSMFMRKAPQYPKLRGKAAEIKYFAGAMLHVWTKYASSKLHIHKTITTYLKLNLEVEELLILHRDKVCFPEKDAEQFQNLVTSMLLAMTQIADHFIEQKMFNITQKAHFLQHISLLAGCVNPRLSWCFMGEDMQRRMSTLAKCCVQGQKAGQTIHKVIQRYRLALHIQFTMR